MISLKCSDEFGSKNFDPGWVGPIFSSYVSGLVSHLWFGFGFGKFPLKMSIFLVFPFGQKNIFWSGQKVPG